MSHKDSILNKRTFSKNAWDFVEQYWDMFGHCWECVELFGDVFLVVYVFLDMLPTCWKKQYGLPVVVFEGTVESCFLLCQTMRKG